MNIVKKSRRGLICYNVNDSIVGKSLYNYGEYSEGQTIVFFDFVKEKDRVVDIGANCGYFTIIFSRIVGGNGLVFAFEAQKRMFNRLCANITINNLENVECHQVVLANKKDNYYLPNIIEENEFNYSGINLAVLKEKKEGCPVQSKALDDYKLEKITFIKIAVEGMEKLVLEGAEKTITDSRPIVYLRTDKKENEIECRNFFADKNYILCCLTSTLYSENNYYSNNKNVLINDKNQTFIVKNLLCVPEEKRNLIPDVLMSQIKNVI